MLGITNRVTSISLSRIYVLGITNVSSHYATRRRGITTVDFSCVAIFRIPVSVHRKFHFSVFLERNMASFKGGNEHGVAHLDNVSGSQTSVGVGLIHQSKDADTIMFSGVWCDTTQDGSVNSPPLYDLVSVTVSTATEANLFYRLSVNIRLIL